MIKVSYNYEGYNEEIERIASEIGDLYMKCHKILEKKYSNKLNEAIGILLEAIVEEYEGDDEDE